MPTPSDSGARPGSARRDFTDVAAMFQPIVPMDRDSARLRPAPIPAPLPAPVAPVHTPPRPAPAAARRPAPAWKAPRLASGRQNWQVALPIFMGLACATVYWGMDPSVLERLTADRPAPGPITPLADTVPSAAPAQPLVAEQPADPAPIASPAAEPERAEQPPSAAAPQQQASAAPTIASHPLEPAVPSAPAPVAMEAPAAPAETAAPAPAAPVSPVQLQAEAVREAAVQLASATPIPPSHTAPARAGGKTATPSAHGPYTPFTECDEAIAAAERTGPVPSKLLPSIARVESGRLDAATGRVRPWPWTINVEGTGHYFNSKAEVISAVQSLQARGVRSIDVGCMQVNLMYHAKAFSDLDEAFDPSANARYAVKFLSALYQMSKNWNLATAWYHSADPVRGEEYQRLVFGRVMTPMGAGGVLASAANFGIGLFGNPAFGTGAAGAGRGSGQFAAIPPISMNFGAFNPPQQPVLYGFTPLPPKGLAATPASSPSRASARGGMTWMDQLRARPPG